MDWGFTEMQWFLVPFASNKFAAFTSANSETVALFVLGGFGAESQKDALKKT